MQKFTIRGKTYDLADAADLVSIQNALVPDNWAGKKADGVRLFLALQEMGAHQLRRHLAANFKKIAQVALEEGADGGTAKIGLTFSLEVDFTSPMVAALTKIALGYSVRHGTTGKPMTHDLTQGELPGLESDMTAVLDTGSIDREKAEAKEAEEKAKREAKEAEDKTDAPDGTVPPNPTASDAPPATESKRTRRRSGK